MAQLREGANRVTAGTLYALAFEAGYTKPVTFVDDTEWEPLEAEEAPKQKHIVVDLPKPHGLSW